MTKNDLLEADKLLAYCAGKLDDPVAVEHIRSSEACKKWIGEHRLIRLLAKGGEGQQEFSDIGQDKLNQFVAEELPADEMLEIEAALTKNVNLFEDYLAIRTEQIAAREPAPSKELDDRVLNMLLANVADTSQPAKPIRSPLSESASNIQDYLNNFFAPRKLAWAGAIAATLLITVVGGKQMGLYGVPLVRPLIVANLGGDDVILKFRDGTTDRKVVTVSNGLLASVILNLGSEVAQTLLKFEKEPSKPTLVAAVMAINISVAKLDPEVFPSDAKNARFDISKINGIQIHPSLWKKIQSGPSNISEIIVSVLKTADPDAPPNPKKSESTPTLNILYFAVLK